MQFVQNFTCCCCDLGLSKLSQISIFNLLRSTELHQKGQMKLFGFKVILKEYQLQFFADVMQQK